MRIGIPRGLFYYSYHRFMEEFLTMLGAELIVSENTNQQILDLGIQNCVDESCLPVKIFHGHVGMLIDQCDYIFVPRVMKVAGNEYICPKFCGLTEMIHESYPKLRSLSDHPIYADSTYSLYQWCKQTGRVITKDRNLLFKAFHKALSAQSSSEKSKEGGAFSRSVGVIGHPYNVFDCFANRNVIKKLERLGAKAITERDIPENRTNLFGEELYKRPFWTFLRRNYGLAVYLYEHHLVDGIIYISSFSCGIDSVVIELIQKRIEGLPIMVLKLDEQTGEEGLNTRLEAFYDLLGRGYL